MFAAQKWTFAVRGVTIRDEQNGSNTVNENNNISQRKYAEKCSTKKKQTQNIAI